MDPKKGDVTCTACAGTMLLEFGLLSALTGDRQWVDMASRAAEVRACCASPASAPCCVLNLGLGRGEKEAERAHRRLAGGSTAQWQQERSHL